MLKTKWIITINGLIKLTNKSIQKSLLLMYNQKYDTTTKIDDFNDNPMELSSVNSNIK